MPIIAAAGSMRAKVARATPSSPRRLTESSGVVGRLRGCAADADWCQVQVGDYRGYLRRSQMWGLNPGEAIN